MSNFEHKDLIEYCKNCSAIGKENHTGCACSSGISNEFKDKNKNLIDSVINYMKREISDKGKYACIPDKDIKLIENLTGKSIDEILA